MCSNNDLNKKDALNQQRVKITYEIKERYGVLSTTPNGWTKELNLVSWNGGVPKFDVREWAPDHMHMRKGITFNVDEMEKMKSILAAV